MCNPNPMKARPLQQTSAVPVAKHLCVENANFKSHTGPVGKL